MSYEVLARKWRPKVLDQLVGQGHITQTLLNSLRAGRIPHALLFTGPRGTGKTSTARILAKSLRCPDAKDFVPCNVCSDCEDISLSRAVDVIEIDGASNNGVDAIRELRESVGFMPSSGKYKVYIIDEVHMLSGSAFNALLKTLEEPPPHVIFILATTEVQKIPNTVLSRCQRYDFRKISTKMIATHLESICKNEKVKFEKEALWAIARQGGGSMRDSQSLLDQVINFCNGDLSLKKVTDVLGLTDRQILLETLTALTERSTSGAVAVVEKIFQMGYDPIVFMRDLLEEIRHLLLAKVAPNQVEAVIDLPSEEIQSLQSLGAKLSEEDVHMIFDMALKGAEDIYRSQDARVVLEMVLMRMAIAPRLSQLQFAGSATEIATTATPSVATQFSRAATQPPAGAHTQTARTPVNAKTEATQPSTPPAGSLAEKWTEFVDRVRKVNGLVAAQLDQLHLVAQEGTLLRIGVPEKYKFLADQVNDPNFHKKLVNYLNTFWGPGHTIKVDTIGAAKSETVAPSPVKLKEQKQQEEVKEINRQVDEHPLVRQAKTILNTQVKSIRENS